MTVQEKGNFENVDHCNIYKLWCNACFRETLSCNSKCEGSEHKDLP